MTINIPKSHPRYHSLMAREKIAGGMEKGVVAKAGLFAHGRGEAYDYLIGEASGNFALDAIRAGVAAMLLAENPVLSVNGNIAALCPEETVQVAVALEAKLEINLFYRTPGREEAILDVLVAAGAKKEEVLGISDDASACIPELGGERRRVDPRGILLSDAVLVPLEDGDRTEALVKMGKKVITIDLNPLSRTARTANISIIDNVMRVFPAMIQEAGIQRKAGVQASKEILAAYSNAKALSSSLRFISRRLEELSREI